MGTSISLGWKSNALQVLALEEPIRAGRGLFKGRDASGSDPALQDLSDPEHRSHADGVRALWDSRSRAHSLINVTPVGLVGVTNDMCLVKSPLQLPLLHHRQV